jgi:isoquinoline 1-oxidoreductase beta subunit
MSSSPQLQRRDFLKITVGASSGLLIGFYVPGLSEIAEAATANEFSPNAFVRIGTNDQITIIVNHSEMGQGVYTALPMLLADELDANWKDVHFEPAPVDKVYNHPVFGMQMTGGSTSVASSFEHYRKAGAAARAMLVQAAAQQWSVDPSQCTTEAGHVKANGKELPYGKLAEAASKLTPPANVQLKDSKDLKLIGKPLKRLDTAQKVNGSGEYGLDVKIPGMLTAVVARSEVFGGKVKSVDDSAARKIPGVKNVFQVPSGVAVVADGFWSAKRGRDALKITWDEGEMAGYTTEKQFAEYAELAKKPGTSARNDGNAQQTLSSATRKIEAAYQLPYVAHANMEPLNCVVDLRNNKCMVYTGSQFQTLDRKAAAEVAGVPEESAQLHTTLLGGGFGRRANPHNDFVREATAVAKQAGAPVKVIWTREDDMHGGYYRPAFYHWLSGAIDEQGMPVAWLHRAVGQSIMQGTPFEMMIKNGVDETSVEGAADLKYAIPNFAVELHSPKNAVTVQWWRSVGHSHTAFATECFLDELAALGKQDPYELRKKLLAKEPRLLGVLNLAAEKAGWGSPLPKGHGRGIACHESFGSFSAQVAEVSVEDGKVRVHKAVCAIDCGSTVNPNIIEAQVEGGFLFGMSAALYNELTLKDGRVVQSNFHDVPMVRINETPEIEVHIVPSTEKPSGVGEPNVPCAAPAIANAIFAATGKRIRKLPVRMSEAV